MAELTTGIKGYAEEYVTENNTATAMKSGGLDVYATPRMINMMEYTAWSSVEPYMDEGCGTVGTHLDVSHVAASPVSAFIKYESELTEIDGRKLVFTVKAYDDAGLIGEGRHERFIIRNDRFMQKTNSKIKG
jgi:predicted thioesterase